MPRERLRAAGLARVRASGPAEDGFERSRRGMFPANSARIPSRSDSTSLDTRGARRGIRLTSLTGNPPEIAGAGPGTGHWQDQDRAIMDLRPRQVAGTPPPDRII